MLNQIAAFLGDLLGPDEPHHLVAIDPDSNGPGKLTGRLFAADAGDKLAKFVEAQNVRYQRDVYFTLNRVDSRPKHGKDKKSDISAVRGYGIDIDPPDPCADLDVWRNGKVEELQESEKPPTAIWCSGNGIQAVWMLREPVPIESEHDWPKHEAINAALARQFGGDHTQNIDRLFRAPYTTNFPSPRKRAKGRVVTEAYVIEGPND